MMPLKPPLLIPIRARATSKLQCAEIGSPNILNICHEGPANMETVLDYDEKEAKAAQVTIIATDSCGDNAQAHPTEFQARR